MITNDDCALHLASLLVTEIILVAYKSYYQGCPVDFG